MEAEFADLIVELEPAERSVLLDFCDVLMLTLPDFASSRQAFLDLLADDSARRLVKVGAGMVNECARAACSGSDPWARERALQALESLRERLATLCAGGRSPVPAASHGHLTELGGASPPPAGPLSRVSDAEFVFRVYELLLERGCRPSEHQGWVRALASGQARRSDLVRAAQADAGLQRLREARHAEQPGGGFGIMDSQTTVTADDWRSRRAQIAANPSAAAQVPPPALDAEAARRAGRPLVSVITSLYRGSTYLARFLDNLAGQTCFAEGIELIIVDAASPEGEEPAIRAFASGRRNVRYTRLPRRVGVYEAWNLAIAEARGEYLTNANVDDLRRSDSIACQAAVLDTRPEVDVVYQDFYYTLDPTLSYEQVAAIGFRTHLPPVDAEVMMRCNPPHHAPMWRRSLHVDLGLFDVGYTSAGDYEFWLRCLAAGRRFHGQDDPHAVYFQNPHGVSTSAQTRSLLETRAILRKYARSFAGQAGAGQARDAEGEEKLH